MTLHEAIQLILKEKARSMSASEIAEILNRNGLYCKSDGSLIKGGQISARVNNYPQLFTKLNGVISLKSPTGIPTIKTKKTPTIRVIVETDNNTSICRSTATKKP